MRSAALFGIAVTLLSGGTVLAQQDKYSITPEEHAACDADAISLCAATYPDEDDLLSCMKSKRPQLSPTCQTAFTAGLKRRHIPP